MLHHLAGATIQIANLVNYNCHPLEDGNKVQLNICNSIPSSSNFLLLSR